MSDDTPERAEPDPVRRRAGRTVPPIIDLKADAPKTRPPRGHLLLEEKSRPPCFIDHKQQSPDLWCLARLRALLQAQWQPF